MKIICNLELNKKSYIFEKKGKTLITNNTKVYSLFTTYTLTFKPLAILSSSPINRTRFQ